MFESLKDFALTNQKLDGMINMNLSYESFVKHSKWHLYVCSETQSEREVLKLYS